MSLGNDEGSASVGRVTQTQRRRLWAEQSAVLALLDDEEPTRPTGPSTSWIQVSTPGLRRSQSTTKLEAAPLRCIRRGIAPPPSPRRTRCRAGDGSRGAGHLEPGARALL